MIWTAWLLPASVSNTGWIAIHYDLCLMPLLSRSNSASLACCCLLTRITCTTLHTPPCNIAFTTAITTYLGMVWVRRGRYLPPYHPPPDTTTTPPHHAPPPPHLCIHCNPCLLLLPVWVVWCLLPPPKNTLLPHCLPSHSSSRCPLPGCSSHYSSPGGQGWLGDRR